jgi:anti-sigma factor RsiW
MDCKLVRTHLDAYVDAELEPTPVIAFERHLDECSGCRNELALGRLIQQGVRDLPRPQLPVGLQRRVLKALDTAEGTGTTGVDVRRWPSLAPLSVAALALVAVSVSIAPDHARPIVSGPAPMQLEAANLFGDIVARHTDQLPADIPAEPPEAVTNWFRGKVGFRVRSVEFTEPQVRFVGARVSHIGDRQAASFYYTFGGNRLTTVVFQATPGLQNELRNAELMTRAGAHRQQVGGRVLTYQNVHGYTVPIVEQDGLVYAFTGDLDQSRLLRLVSSARLP